MEFYTGCGKKFLADSEYSDLILSLSLRVDCNGYVSHYTNKAGNKKREDVRLHRIIMGVKNPKVFVDHINGDILDNRKCNLRLCSNSQNTKNRKKHKNGTLKYKGIVKDKRYGGYVAKICVNYKRLYLGRYRTQEEAALAYNYAAIQHHGEFARLNKVFI